MNRTARDLIVAAALASLADAPAWARQCGQPWSLRSSAGPVPRDWAAMAYDGARQRVVLFGGRTASQTCLNDTWEWDGATWTQRVAPGPAPRYSHGMTYDTQRQRIVMFGGFDCGLSGVLADTWEWDGAAWTIRSTGGPSARAQVGLVYDQARARTVPVS